MTNKLPIICFKNRDPKLNPMNFYKVKILKYDGSKEYRVQLFNNYNEMKSKQRELHRTKGIAKVYMTKLK